MPLAAASILIPAIINSRIRIINTTQEGKTFNSTKAINAANTKILSAKGSINLPKFVTWFLLLAKYPSTLSVTESTTKITKATQGLIQSSPPLGSIQFGQGEIKATTKTGTNNIRIIVTTFALVQMLFSSIFLATYNNSYKIISFAVLYFNI